MKKYFKPLQFQLIAVIALLVFLGIFFSLNSHAESSPSVTVTPTSATSIDVTSGQNATFTWTYQWHVPSCQEGCGNETNTYQISVENDTTGVTVMHYSTTDSTGNDGPAGDQYTAYGVTQTTNYTVYAQVSSSVSGDSVEQAVTFTANVTPAVTPGVCSNPPIHYTCATPTQGNNTASGPTAWTWDCPGSNGGPSISCSETKPLPVNGVCSSPAVHYTCSSPTASTNNTNTSTAWTWNCPGSNNGTNTSCSEPFPTGSMSASACTVSPSTGTCSSTIYWTVNSTSSTYVEVHTDSGSIFASSNGSGSQALTVSTTPVNLTLYDETTGSPDHGKVLATITVSGTPANATCSMGILYTSSTGTVNWSASNCTNLKLNGNSVAGTCSGSNGCSMGCAGGTTYTLTADAGQTSVAYCPRPSFYDLQNVSSVTLPSTLNIAPGSAGSAALNFSNVGESGSYLNVQRCTPTNSPSINVDHIPGCQIQLIR